MRKLSVFESVSLDGYFKTPNGDIAWMHQGGDDPEFQAFTAGNAGGGGMLLLGRTTYELFASFWPTPQAMQQMPEVAGPMNAMPKVVVSRSLQKATWNNTKVLKGDLAEEVRKLKAGPGDGITVLGSGSIVSQLTQAGLVDEFQVVLLPVVLGEGGTMFEGVKGMLNLKLLQSRTFRNGGPYLVYEPMSRREASSPRRVVFAHQVHDRCRTRDPERLHVAERLDLVAADDAFGREQLRRLIDIVGDHLEPDLRLAHRRHAVDPELVASEPEAQSGWLRLDGLEADHVAVEADRGLVLVRRHLHRDVAAGGEVRHGGLSSMRMEGSNLAHGCGTFDVGVITPTYAHS